MELPLGPGSRVRPGMTFVLNTGMEPTGAKPKKKPARRYGRPVFVFCFAMRAQAKAGNSLFSPAMRNIAFCTFSNARTSIWRTRSRLTL